MSHGLLEEFFSLSPDMLCIAGIDGYFKEINPAWARILGLDVETLKSRPFVEFVHPDDRVATQAEAAKLSDPGSEVQTVSFENRYRTRDGSYRWLNWSARLASDGRHILAVARDVTTAKQRLLALSEASRAAQAADAAKSEFLANMSHELRTPLNSIIGFSSLLLREKVGPLLKVQREYLGRVHDNGVRLLGLINDVLDLSKIEAGRLRVNEERIELAEAITRVVESLEAQANARGLLLHAAIPDGLQPLLADAQRLEQILTNLVANAIKFTEMGGVMIEVLHDEGRPLRIDVLDTGIGVAPERVERLFNPFEQADSSTARAYGGTGLGLSISKALAELMHFRIGVASVVDEGACFSVLLAADATEPAWREPDWPDSIWSDSSGAELPAANRLPPPATTRDEDDPPTPLVLSVDDDPDARSVLGHILQEEGYRVVSCSTPSLAVDIARAIHPDVITLDISMPEERGDTLMRRIRRDPSLGNIPIVVVSIVGRDIAHRLPEASAIVDKPTADSALVDAIRRALTSSPRSVLVVDDDPDTRALMVSLVRERGAEVREAADGRAALAILENFAPDLILLDLTMPLLSGFDLLSLLQADARLAHTRITVVTARELSSGQRSELLTRSDRILRKDEGFAAALEALLREYASDPKLDPGS